MQGTLIAASSRASPLTPEPCFNTPQHALRRVNGHSPPEAWTPRLAADAALTKQERLERLYRGQPSQAEPAGGSHLLIRRYGAFQMRQQRRN